MNQIPQDVKKDLRDTNKELKKIIKYCNETYEGTNLFKDAKKIWIEQCQNKNSTEEKK